MRSTVWAFLALFGVLVTLSFVQAAVPALFAINNNIGDASQADIATDPHGNSYYIVKDALDPSIVFITAVAPDGQKYTGCPSANLGTVLSTALGAAFQTDATLAGFTIVSDRAFPQAPNTNVWLMGTLCTATRCDLFRAPVAVAATALNSCPVTFSSATATGLGQITGTFTGTGPPATVNCLRYSATSAVTMTSNPTNGVLYIACFATVSGSSASYVIQTQPMNSLAAATFAGFATATNNIAYRVVNSATAIISSMTVDTYGSVWAVETVVSSVSVLKPFATTFSLPNSASSNVGGQATWTRPSSTYKFVSVTSDRSGNVYLGANDVGTNGNIGYILTFPAVAIITPPTTTTIPKNWAYFSTGSTFESSGTIASGVMTYDPYRGRLIVNLNNNVWYNIPLFTVQFDFAANTPATLFDTNGAACQTESATCVRVPVMISNQASNFVLRVVAPTWPSAVASLPFTATPFILSGASPSINPNFPTSITSTSFTSAASAIGSTGSNVATFTSAVTISNPSGFAGLVTLSPTFTSASNDVSFLFTSIPSTTIVVQGSITAAAVSSTTYPISSSILLAGLPTRYTLTLSPTPSGTCTSPAVTFTNTNDHSYFTSASAIPASGASLSVPFSGTTASLFYATTIVTAYNWQGSFSGTGAGCTQIYGAVRVPFYNIAVTTTARPSISISPIDQLITPSVPSNFQLRLVPGPSAAVSPDMPVTFRSGLTPSTTGTNAAPCTGGFNTFTSVYSTGCTSAAPCVISNQFTANSGACSLTTAASAAVVAEIGLINNLTPSAGTAYWYWNAATQTVVQIPTSGTISVYTITSALSTRLRWSSAAGGVPTNQIVAPGAALGPFIVDYTGPAISVTFSTLFGGSFVVLNTGANTNTYPTFSAANFNAAAWTTGALTISTGSLVFFRAPSPATGAMLAGGPFDISIATPTGVTYDGTSSPVQIRIRYVVSLSSPSNPRAAASVPANTANINLWAGTSERTRNTVTVNWGSGTFAPTASTPAPALTIYAVSSVADNLVGLFLPGSAITIPSTAINTAAAASADNAAGVTACSASGAGCASLTIPLPLNTSSVSFILAGGVPGSTLSFFFSVAGSDSNSFGFPSILTARLFGQVLFSSLPTSIAVNVPTFFGVSIDPVAPAATALSVSDASNSNFGTFLFCADSSCGASVAPAAGPPVSFNLATFTSALVGVNTVLQYVPPVPNPASCSGGISGYPCALGTRPLFGFDLDTSYAFDWTPSVNSNVGGNFNQQSGKFKLNVENMPQLTGSVAISFINFEAATDPNSPPIGVNIGANTFTYPIASDASTSLPIPMSPPVGLGAPKPVLNFLAGVRYLVGVTMYPPPASTAAPQLTVMYQENNIAVTPAQNFTYNRLDANAPAPIAGSPALASTVTIFPASSASFTGSRIDAGLKDLTPAAVTAFPSMCSGGAIDTNGNCYVGFFYWTVPSITSGPPANNPRLTFTVSGTGVTNYPTQSQTVKISGWCGPSANLRDPIAPTPYGVPTTVTAVCTPALPSSNFLNVYQGYTGVGPTPVFSQLQFFAPASSFVAGTTTWTAPTGAGNDAGVSVAGNNLATGSLMQVFRVAGDASANLAGTTSLAPAVLIYSAISLTGADRTAVNANLLSNYVQTRIYSAITGTYTVRIANADITSSCAFPSVNYLVDATRLSSVSSTSTNYGQVCLYPFRTGDGPTHTVTLSDGLGVATNTFTAARLVAGGVVSPFVAGVLAPATFFGVPTPGVTTGGMTGTMTAASNVLAYDGFIFIWDLASAATNIADFRLCSVVATSAYVSGNLPAAAICAPNAFPSFPVGPAAGLPLSYRQFATSANSLAVTYGSNRVPISVTMKFTARGFGANDFSTTATSSPAINFLVGETYAIELRTANSAGSPYSSPAVAGLTVTLNDLCGVLSYPGGGANPTPAASPVAVPARGQWSNTTLFFSPGETTKIVFYTPREICAPVTVSGVTTNWGTILTGTVATDLATSPDGNAVRFVNPVSVWVHTFGAVRVDNVPAYLPAGVATPNPVTVTLSPPLLAPGQTYATINGLTISDLTVTVSDRAPSIAGIATGDASGGSFISAQNLGASATLAFSTAGPRASASVSYVAPPSNFFLDSAPAPAGVSRGLSFVLSGAGAPLYRIVSGAASSVYNGLASIAAANVAPGGGVQDLWNGPTATAATFTLRIVPESAANTNPNVAAAPAPIEGVYFNVIGGAALAQSTSASLATVSDNISQFVGNSNVLPGQANNAINFNLPFVSGVPFGYFAAVPFNISAVVVNVATTANTVFVNNNGWPNAKSVGGSVGGYVLPNALSGYVSPVFFLTPGLNTFLVAAPQGGVADAFAFGSIAGSGTLNNGANGDGIVYRFTIARDTITSFGLFVSANGHAGLPWSANLPRLQPQYVAGSTPSLLAVGPGSGTAQATFTVNVENAVQSVGILAQFYGALKARVTSNVNEFGQILVNIPNNRLVDFPLVVPTNLPGVSAATTSITLLGGGLGPLTINVNRNGKGLNFGSQVFSAGSAVASNIVDGPNGPCIVRTATTFGLAIYPSSRPSLGGLAVSGSYRIGSAAPITFAQTVSPTSGWEVGSVPNYVSLATVATSISTASLPIILNIAANYPGNVPSEFTPLNNYALNLCPV